jgi:hypothetical protein
MGVSVQKFYQQGVIAAGIPGSTRITVDPELKDANGDRVLVQYAWVEAEGANDHEVMSYNPDGTFDLQNNGASAIADLNWYAISFLGLKSPEHVEQTDLGEEGANPSATAVTPR